MTDRTIAIATTDDDILNTFNVMQQLRPNIKSKEEYLKLVRLQQHENRFSIAALREGDAVICVTGFRFCRSLGWGKFLYVDDLVTDEKFRSVKSAGKDLFAWLVAHAKVNQCEEVRLDSATYRTGAHRFYLREKMEIACFNFRLGLQQNR